MHEQVAAILKQGRWLGETEIVRAAYPGRRDGQISDQEWQAAINALRKSGAQSKNLGQNVFVWSAR